MKERKAARAGLSNEGQGTFGRNGRPPKPRVQERLRIYRAAGPLILSRGVVGTTMRDISRRARLSPAGIYNYFCSKRDLVLYGLNPEALSNACLQESVELERALCRLPPVRIRRIVELYVEKNLRMLAFVRPALQAAIELGRTELRESLSRGFEEDADYLVSALTELRAGPSPQASANLIRRTILGLALDEQVTEDEARAQLYWLFDRLLPGRRRASAP